jgi:hypothetical protein
MSDCPLCNLEQGSNAGQNPSFLGRVWRSVQWLFPAAMLAIVPKCPMCVAAYVALFTGVGISVSTARWIQVSMVVCGIGSLAYMARRYYRGRVSR